MVQTGFTGLILIAKEVDGVEMGVLDDGTAFLTGRGLAKACGVAPSAIIKQAGEWESGKRSGDLARLLVDAGYDEELLYIPLKDGSHAYTDSVATLIIEYYALDVDKPQARVTARHLMRGGLRTFVYERTGYNPRAALSPAWQDFHDRLELVTAPMGYFSVFREMDEFILRAIRAGLRLGQDTVPDGSVGKIWGNHWKDALLDEKYGPRRRWEHNYPSRYAQALSNPQEIWVYPMEAMGAFHRWLHEVYVPDKFPAYLKGKVKNKTLASAEADKLLAAIVPAALKAPDADDA